MQASTLNIIQLFRRLSNSDETALWELHAHFFPKLYRFVLALAGNKELTEEIVNDTFFDLWQKRLLLNNVNNPDVYIFICAKNRAIKVIKKQNNYNRALQAYYDVPCQVELTTPHDMLVSSEIQRRINTAIAELPPQCKLVFSLIKENNLKYKEVATLLGLSPKTVENQMAIALKKLGQSIPLTLIS